MIFNNKYCWKVINDNNNVSVLATWDSNINNNENLDLKKIKHSLVELIDKSQLYLSYSEIEDKKHNIDKDTFELNSQFYKWNR